MIALFFPVTSVLLGIGLLRAGTVSRYTAAMLILGGVSFLVAQAAEWQMQISYPLAALLWLIGLAPLGWKYMTEELAERAGAQQSSS